MLPAQSARPGKSAVVVGGGLIRLWPRPRNQHDLKKIYGIGAGKVIQITQDRRTQNITVEGTFDDREEQNLDTGAQSEDASIQLVNEIITEAIRQHTTDIHTALP